MGRPLDRKTHQISTLKLHSLKTAFKKGLIKTVYSCASLVELVCFTWIKAAAGIKTTMGPDDENHVACTHPPDYHERVFPVILHSGRRRSLLLSRFSQRLCPAHSSNTWDVWVGVDGLSRSASQSALEERTFTDRLQEKILNTD